GDLWGAQSVPGGHYILLRHGHPSRTYATYEWLTSDTLERAYRTESYDLAGPIATEDSIAGGSPWGMELLGRDGHTSAICSTRICPKYGQLAFIGPHSVAFLDRTAVGVIDTNLGLLWSIDIDPRRIPQVGDLQSASRGRRFAFVVYGSKGVIFR